MSSKKGVSFDDMSLELTHHRQAAALLLLFFATVTSPAAAQRVAGVALMPLETVSSESDEARQVLGAIRDAMGPGSRFTERGPIEMGLEEARMSYSCFDEKPGCMAQVGKLVEADLLVWGRLTKKGSEYVLDLSLVDVQKATAKRQTFVQAGHSAIDKLGEQAVEFVVGRRVEATGSVAIRSLPAGALVYIDGVARGSTPTQVDLSFGLHAMELRLGGMEPFQKDLDVRTGSMVVDESLREIRVSPRRAAAGDPEVESVDETLDAADGRPWFWAGVASAGLAVVSVGGLSIFGLRALEAQSEAENASKNLNRARWEAAKGDIVSNQSTANLFLGGAALTGVASVLFFSLGGEGDVAEVVGQFKVSPLPFGVSVGGGF